MDGGVYPTSSYIVNDPPNTNTTNTINTNTNEEGGGADGGWVLELMVVGLRVVMS